MECTLTPVTAPTEEPVALASSEDHNRVDHNTEGDLIASYVIGSRQSIEKACNRSFCTQTWDLKLPRFPRWHRFGDERRNCFYLPRSPVASVTSITYYDTLNVQQTLTLATYVDQHLSALPAELHLKYGYSWPSTYSRPDAVTVRYVAGTAAADVPDMIKAAIRVMAADLYEHRTSQGVGTISFEIPALTERNLRAQYEIPDLTGFM